MPKKRAKKKKAGKAKKVSSAAAAAVGDDAVLPTPLDVCAPQVFAQRLLNRIVGESTSFQTHLAEEAAAGRPPPPDAGLPMLLAKFQEQIDILRVEAARGTAERPRPAELNRVPREVLTASAAFELIPPELGGDCISASERSNGVVEILCYMKADTSAPQRRMIGLNIQTASVGFGTGFGRSKLQRLGIMPLRRDMGTWPAANWAWLIGCLLRRFGFDPAAPPSMLRLSHKLCTVPDLEDPLAFSRAVAAKWRDIAFAPRFGFDPAMKRFWAFVPVDSGDTAVLFNDLALAFDVRMWRVAVELGLSGVEDRTRKPAVSFYVGDEVLHQPFDCRGKLWPSQESYIRWRLSEGAKNTDAGVDFDLHRIVEFMLDLLNSQTMQDNTFDDPALRTSYAERELKDSTFISEQLPRRVRKACRKHGLPVPQVYRDGGGAMGMGDRHVAGSIKCCFVCGAVTKMKGVAKVTLSRCGGCNGPYYCGAKCQREAWPQHKKDCKAAQKKQKKQKQKKQQAEAEAEAEARGRS